MARVFEQARRSTFYRCRRAATPPDTLLLRCCGVLRQASEAYVLAPTAELHMPPHVCHTVAAYVHFLPDSPDILITLDAALFACRLATRSAHDHHHCCRQHLRFVH